MSNIGLAQAQISSAGGGVSPEDLAAALAGYVLVDGSRAMTGPLVIGHPAGGYGLTLNSLSGASLGLYSYSSGTLDYWIGTFGAHGLRLATNASGGSIIIAPTGEVGIGVAPVASYAATLGLTKIAHSGAEVSLGGTGGNFFIQNLVTGKDIIFYNSANQPLFIFKDNGSVGIGTVNPIATKLAIESIGRTAYFWNKDDTVGDAVVAIFGGSGGAEIVSFNVGGVTEFVGPIGIGTDNPQSLLHLKSGTHTYLTVDSGVDGNAGIRFDKDGTNVWYIYNNNVNNAVNFFTNSANRVIFYADGHVYMEGKLGIGIADPVQTVDIAGSTGMVGYPIAITTGAQTKGVARFSIPSYDSFLDFGFADADPWGAWIQMHNASNANAFPLTLNPRGGNVGIGTIAPAVLLDMFSSVADAALSLATSASGGFSILNLLRSSDARGSVVKFGTYAGATDWYIGTLYNDGSQSLSFSIAPTYLLVDAKFNMTATGLVGIGTIAQTELFQVAGGKIRIGTPSTGDVSPTLSFYSTGSEGQIYQNAGDLFLGHSGAVVDLLQLHISGPISTNCGFHVGGTSDPGDNNFLVDGTVKSVGAFACNNSTPQTPAASGGALNAYGAGANGLDTGSNMSSLHALVVAIRAALVANGIMS